MYGILQMYANVFRNICLNSVCSVKMDSGNTDYLKMSLVFSTVAYYCQTVLLVVDLVM